MTVQELKEWAAGVGKCCCGYQCPHDKAQRELEKKPQSETTGDA